MKVLLAGESWSIISQNTLGFDSICIGRYTESAGPLKQALEMHNIEVDYYPNHKSQLCFPDTIQELADYDAVILSDIGSNTLLLHPDTQNRCIRKNNKLSAVKEYVLQGGGLLMCGGYMSFSGIGGKARYGMTPIADILPVEILNYDDRVEKPEGVFPTIINKSHPVMHEISDEWPDFLGYNKLQPKPEADVIAKFGEDVFMASATYGRGRSFVFASDSVPHWGTIEFVNWRCYHILWKNIIFWLAKK